MCELTRLIENRADRVGVVQAGLIFKHRITLTRSSPEYAY